MDRLRRAPAIVTFLVATLLIVARRPEQLFAPVAVIEEGAVYLARAIAEGPASIFAPYAGLPRLTPRVIGILESFVAPPIAPAIGAFVATVVVAAIAGLIVSTRLAHLLPSTRARIGLALLFVLTPAADEQLGVMADVERYLPIALALLLFATPPVTRLGRWLERGGVLIAVGSGATALLVAPLYLLAALRPDPAIDRRELRFRLGAIGLGVAASLGTALLTSRGGVAVEPAIALAGTAVHTVVGVMGSGLAFGVDMAIGRPTLILFGVLLLAAVAVCGWALLSPRRRLDGVLLIGSSLVASFLSMDPSAAPVYDDPRVAHRYAFLLGMAASMLLFAGYLRFRRTRAHWPAVFAGALAISGIAAGFRLPPFPESGWGAASPCIGGPLPCVVPAWPPEVWSIEWPGAGQPYLEPRPGS